MVHFFIKYYNNFCWLLFSVDVTLGRSPNSDKRKHFLKIVQFHSRNWISVLMNDWNLQDWLFLWTFHYLLCYLNINMDSYQIPCLLISQQEMGIKSSLFFHVFMVGATPRILSLSVHSPDVLIISYLPCHKNSISRLDTKWLSQAYRVGGNQWGWSLWGMRILCLH